MSGQEDAVGELKVLTLAGLGAFGVSAVTLAPVDCVTACASASGDPDPAGVSICDTVLGYRAPPVGMFLLVPLVAVGLLACLRAVGRHWRRRGGRPPVPGM